MNIGVRFVVGPRMNTFDAMAYIRRESLSRADALRYLIEHLGFSALYADEIVAVIFGTPAIAVEKSAMRQRPAGG